MQIRGYILLFFFALAMPTVWAQSMYDYAAAGLEETDITEKIPPLDSLINKAKENSPLLKYYGADITYWEGRVKRSANAWMNSIYIDAAYGYGVFDNLSTQQFAGDLQASQALFITEQSRYNLGVSMKMPIGAIFTRGKEIKTAKAEVNKAIYQKEFAIMELEQLVLQQYNDLVRSHRLLFINGSKVETYKLQSVRAEKDFANGIIDIVEYTRLQQMLNNALLALETERAAYLLAVKMLESTVGIDLKL